MYGKICAFHLFIVVFVSLSRRYLVAASNVGPQFKTINFETNTKNFENNRCGTPKPQLYYPGENETSIYFEKEFFPSAVLVHRCAKISGCCGNGESCVAQEQEQVLFTLRLAGTNEEVPVPIANHTSCRCEAVDSQDADDNAPSDSQESARYLIFVALVCGAVAIFGGLVNIVVATYMAINLKKFVGRLCI